jgi:hypothetical protein
MKRSHPVIATWLLQRFIGPEREAFIGDLREQYSHGRSRLWYWRQTLTAMAVGTFTAVGNDRSLTGSRRFCGLGHKGLVRTSGAFYSVHICARLASTCELADLGGLAA